MKKHKAKLRDGQPQTTERGDWREAVSYQEQIVFGWLDRLRVLFGCSMYVTSIVKTQWRVGEVRGAYMEIEIEKLLPKLKDKGLFPVDTDVRVVRADAAPNQ